MSDRHHLSARLFATGLVVSGLLLGAAVPGSARDLASLKDTVRDVKSSHLVPALAAVTVRSDGVEAAAVGHTKVGDDRLVGPRSRFHIGSLSKAVLATAIGSLVEDGRLRWTTTLGQVWPRRAHDVNPALRGVTVRQLLNHRSGLQEFVAGTEFTDLPAWTGSALEQQRRFGWWLLRQPPAHVPGSLHYSNAGYAVAALVGRRVSGLDWLTLVRSEVFGPLGVTAWTGWPARRGVQQPSGHTVVDGHLEVAPLSYRLPVVVAPAGNLSLTPRGYGRFLQLHLRGLRGHGSAGLTARTIRQLHHPTGGYSSGWIETEVSDVPTSLADGTVGTFFALAAIQPTRRQAVATFTNVGGPRGSRAATDLLVRLL